MSLRASRVFPWACSGDMNSGVPKTIPSWVSTMEPGRISWSVTLARPKSSTLGKSLMPPWVLRKMFSGFRSRCTMPRLWASFRAPHTWIRIGSARSRGMGPPVRTTWLRFRPSRYSMTMNREPSSSTPSSKTLTVFGCDRCPSALASRLKRETRSFRFTSFGCRILMATIRSMFGCIARYTAPMPPEPIFCKIRYLPPTTSRPR
jgi:hypothetical protein